MGRKICLDTDFLVNFLRNKQEEVEFVEKNEEEKDLATTIINAFEIYHGAYKSEKKEQNVKAVKELITRLTILDFSLQAAEKAGRLLADLEDKGEKVDFRDLFIGSIARHNGYTIKTGNVKHFEKIEGLEIVE